ncbi:MAG TPA: hypothetical protein VFM56_10635 [Solimonas sp.]|nr:hypothetical protein [Solimonas sp.]
MCAALAALTTACTPAALKHSAIVPMPDNAYEVTSSADSKDQALQWALGAADITCSKRQMRYVVTGQTIAYKGKVAESTNDAIDTAQQIGSVFAGPIAGVFTLRGDHDYTADLKFRCEA